MYNPRINEQRVFVVSVMFVFIISLAFVAEALSGAFTISAEAQEPAASGIRLSAPSNPPVSEAPVEEITISEKSESTPAYEKNDNKCTIISADLSGNPSEGELLMINETKYSPDLYALCESAAAARTVHAVFSDKTIRQYAPKVLIIHTHGTEAFAAEGAVSYPKDALPRSNDISENIVAVGETLCRAINESGVPAIHCTIMHDEESYIKSYDLARNTIIEYLKKYPSIEYVFDVHRDAIMRGDNATVRAVSEKAPDTAQIMFVVGTDENGADHKNWRSNLAFALSLQKTLNSGEAKIARPINLRSSSFNEQYTSGSLLIEIGTCGNTLAEAKRAAQLLGEVIADHIIGS
ncbi:MAG: stage II sporulation protein P [Firmicutes bacterium]|nr:stage II sporulation protein P [Bacillota bacterium]